MSFDLNINLRQTGDDAPAYPKVPNEPATAPAPYRLAIIGEAPGAVEVEAGRPFVGPSGSLLSQVLVGANILRSACYVGNITPYQPPGNNFSYFKHNGPEITEGVDKLHQDLKEFKPNACLLLGNVPMSYMGMGHFGRAKGDEKVGSWRGSIVKCKDPTSPFFNTKCIGTYHPSFIMQGGYKYKPLFIADIRRAHAQAHFTEHQPPEYEFNISPTVDWLAQRLDEINSQSSPIAIDIEGVHPTITCISICTDPRRGFIVPFSELSPDNFKRILRKLTAVLKNPNIPKILQNGFYDATQLAQSFNIPVYPLADDTMLSGWELQPELPKGLGTLASLYTEQPYYKDDRTKEDRDVHYNYCCTDSAVTYEIRNVHRKILESKPEALKHYDFHIKCVRGPLLYIGIRGINYDGEGAKEKQKFYTIKRDEVGERITARGREIHGTNYTLNVNSHKKLQELLYRDLGFPPQYKKEGGRKTTKQTSDEEALLNLFKQFDDPIITDILTWRNFDKRRQFCEILYDKDNRIRSNYNIVGTVTGRVSSSKTAAGTGYNLQTIPKSLRHHLRADPDHHFFQCDLAGADGWTVSAFAASLGDPTMLEDYLAGIKPAKVLALMYHHGPDVNNWSREKIKEASKDISEEGDGWWLYFACKRVQHATSYDAKAFKIAETITKDAYKKDGKLLKISNQRCRELQDLYERVRYRGVLSFKNYVRQQLNTTRGYPALTDAAGHVRTFYGRPRDNATFREALSHMPQANTTYATNLALLRLWQDPANRRSDGTLRIEPLHQVHDAVCGQFRKEDTEWAISRLHSYFDNPLKIADMEIRIPFDGAYGPSWGEMGPSDKWEGGLI